ncbi:MAG: DUF4116 domain-containing protein [Parachlamydiaceae bacterium]|nr:DUF4116 domain-containing protein [Parachlamydiaceae bacterium]
MTHFSPQLMGGPFFETPIQIPLLDLESAQDQIHQNKKQRVEFQNVETQTTTLSSSAGLERVESLSSKIEGEEVFQYRAYNFVDNYRDRNKSRGISCLPKSYYREKKKINDIIANLFILVVSFSSTEDRVAISTCCRAWKMHVNSAMLVELVQIRQEVMWYTPEIRQHLDLILQDKKLRHSRTSIRTRKRIILNRSYPEIVRIFKQNTELQKNEELVFRFLQSDHPECKILEFVHESLRNNKYVVLEALSKDPSQIKFASPMLLCDKKFILDTIRALYCNYNRRLILPLDLVDEKLWQEEDFVKGVCRYYPSKITAAKTLEKKASFVSTVVMVNGMCLKYVARAFREDRAIALNAMSRLETISVVHPKFLEDRDFLKEALTKDGLVFEHMSLYQDDEELLRVAVQQDGYALEWASARLQGNREIVDIAVHANSGSFRYASDELKRDVDFILSILNDEEKIEEIECFIRHISPEVLKNYEFALEAVRKSGEIFKYLSDELKNDKLIACEAIMRDRDAFDFLSDELFYNPDFMLELLNIHDWIMDFIFDEFYDDEEFMLAAIRIDESYISYASKRLKKDKKFLEVVKTQISREALSKLDESSLLKMISKDAKIIKDVADNLVKDLQFMLKTVKLNQDAFVHSNFFPINKELWDALSKEKDFNFEALQHDKNLFLELIKQEAQLIKYASEKLNNDLEFILKAYEINKHILSHINSKMRFLVRGYLGMNEVVEGFFN